MLETFRENHEIPASHALLSWRSVLAGLIISFFSFAVLVSAGLAFNGARIAEADSARSVGAIAGLWFLIATVVSLFLGGYFSARVSKYHTGRIGLSHGLLIAALFFGAFLWQSFSAIGMIGSSVGDVLGGGSQAATQSSTPLVRQIVEDSVDGLTLKNDTDIVVSGLAARLVRGETQSARNYLAYQASISREEADRRIAEMRAQVEATVQQAREAAAKTLQATGWSLFLMTMLGALSAMVGGAWGARSNVVRPLVPERAAGVLART